MGHLLISGLVDVGVKSLDVHEGSVDCKMGFGGFGAVVAVEEWAEKGGVLFGVGLG